MERRVDSRSRFCSARSFLRCSTSVGSDESVAGFDFAEDLAVDVDEERAGGFEDFMSDVLVVILRP